MLNYLLPFLVLFLAISAVILFRLGVTILKSDPTEYKLNREITKSPFKGVVNPRKDSRAQAGMIINKKNEWVEQGRISDEAIDSILN